MQVFGFTSDGIERTPDGTVVHGWVRLGEARIAQSQQYLASPHALTKLNGGLVVRVEDVDRHFARAYRASCGTRRDG